ncbi:MAG: aminodeoxychorismate/anthranilate synthase component II [Oscillospiraceae bacterium]|nr:aminodeoxychorismate/anthranilate synthase component II [Oscillospiraceae bacterium]
MILMIDNYDSFTYNLVQYFRQLDESVCVRRNDQITMLDIDMINPDVIVLSPGPGKPEDAGICTEIVRQSAGRIPILGICLGQQVINVAFGGKTVKAIQPMHGKVKPVYHVGDGVFQGLKSPLNVTRYHSLIVDRVKVPKCLKITAWSEYDEIMGVMHREHLIEGVQFHPEAVLTESGIYMLSNFL